MMTLDPTLFAAAVVTVIAALGGGVVQIINATSASKDRREAAAERRALHERAVALARVTDDTAKKADALIIGTAKIHELTNSTNSNLTKALEVATQKIAGLERLMAVMDDNRRQADSARNTSDLHIALLTPAPVAAAAVPVVAPAPVVAPHTEAILESIERNTAETAAHTEPPVATKEPH